MFNKTTPTKEATAQVEIPTREIKDAPTKSATPADTLVSTSSSLISEGILIKGEITGDNHINIKGKVEGSINLSENEVNIEQSADVKAEVNGKIVRVHGKVTGNITAKEKILVTSSAHLTGDLSAPKVELQDGSYFDGKISMGNVPKTAIKPKTP